MFGILLTIFLPCCVIGLAIFIKNFVKNPEIPRKLIHILLSNWILLAINVFDNIWSIAIWPALFIPINYISYKKRLIPVMERDKNNSPGTVWYAVSLFILCIFGYAVDMPWVAACGMLAMGYGDGLAVLANIFHKDKYFPNNSKSIYGTFIVMFFSALSVGLVCWFYAPDIALAAAVSVMMPAAIIELFSKQGIDNLTLPLGVSLMVFLLATFPFLFHFFLAIGIGLFVLMIAYYKRAITLNGFMVAILLGSLLFLFSGWIGFFPLIIFFVLGSVASSIGKKIKSKITILHEYSGARGVMQVIANGFPQLLFASIYFFTKNEIYLLAVITGFAVALADTWSSEIGILSKKTFSILTLKPMPRGISGGVSLLGLFAGIIGSLIISLFAISFDKMFIVMIVGFIGTIIDSVLGELFQAKYQTGYNQITEKKTSNLIHGIKWMNNNAVNFISILISDLIVIVLALD